MTGCSFSLDANRKLKAYKYQEVNFLDQVNRKFMGICEPFKLSDKKRLVRFTHWGTDPLDNGLT